MRIDRRYWVYGGYNRGFADVSNDRIVATTEPLNACKGWSEEAFLIYAKAKGLRVYPSKRIQGHDDACLLETELDPRGIILYP